MSQNSKNILVDHENIHRQIIDRIFEGKKYNSEYPPCYILTGGGPASGKSAVYAWMKTKEVLYPNTAIVDMEAFNLLPDFVKESKKTNPHPHPEKMSEDCKREYNYLRQRILDEAIKRKVSVLFDDHGEDLIAEQKLVETAKDAGYETFLCAATTPAGTLFSVMHKADALLEYIPWALDITAQFSLKWNELASSFDHVLLFERDFANPVLKLIYDKEKTHPILDEVAYERFNNWKKVNINGVTLEEAFPMGKDETSDDYYRRVGAPRKYEKLRSFAGEDRPGLEESNIAAHARKIRTKAYEINKGL